MPHTEYEEHPANTVACEECQMSHQDCADNGGRCSCSLAPAGLTQSEYIHTALDCLDEAAPVDRIGSKRWQVVMDRVRDALSYAYEQGLSDVEVKP